MRCILIFYQLSCSQILRHLQCATLMTVCYSTRQILDLSVQMIFTSHIRDVHIGSPCKGTFLGDLLVQMIFISHVQDVHIGSPCKGTFLGVFLSRVLIVVNRDGIKQLCLGGFLIVITYSSFCM